MTTLTEFRALKKGNREIDRNLTEGELLTSPDKITVNKGEIATLCWTKQQVKNALSLGVAAPTVPSSTTSFFHQGDFLNYAFRQALINSRMLHSYANAVRTTTSSMNAAADLAVATVVANTTPSLRSIPLGALPSNLTARSATLIITDGQAIQGGAIVASPGNVVITYQTVTTAVGVTPARIIFTASVPASQYVGRKLMVTANSISTTPGDSPVVNFTSSTTVGLMNNTVPATANVIFYASVRDAENFPVINALLAYSGN
uniref:VP11 n=1 Tax=viral metagenome TaxID=1070528 RepID=A0A2V0R9V5_9ZZZZ